MKTGLTRRTILGGVATAAALPLLGLQAGRAAAQAGGELVPMKLPPPIGTDERLQRLAKARMLMKQNGIGAVIVEPGASLDYFTGVQWWRSERLTAAVIPVEGEPIIVTPFFEKPSVEESLKVPAEVRVWKEHEEPLKLVADFLKERGAAGSPVGFEETNRYFILDKLQQQLAGVRVVSANPVVRALRMIKSPAEIALMKAAADMPSRIRG
jgi:Xaa-Pro dipeptidase